MRRLGRLRIRYRILAIVLVMLLPAAATLVYDGYRVRRFAEDRAAAEAAQTARAVATSQARLFESAELLLDLLTRMPEVRSFDSVQCHAMLTDLRLNHPRYASLGVFRPNGDRVCGGMPSAQTVNAADRDWFRGAMETREFAIGDFQLGLVSGKRSLGLAKPILGPDGAVLGVVYAALDLMWISDQVAASPLPPGGAAVLFDSKGTILARYPNPEAWIGKNAADSGLYKYVSTQPSAHSGEQVGLDGVSRLYHVLRVGSTPRSAGVHVAAGVPLDSIRAQIDRDFATDLAILAGFGIVLLGLGYWISERLVSRPLRRLAGFSERVARGDLSGRSGVDHAASEIGGLAASLEAMAGSLARRQEEIGAQNRLLTESQEAAHIGSWEWRIDDPTIRCSAELARIYRLDPGTDELPVDALAARVHPDDRQACFDWSRRVAEGLPRAEYESRLVLPDGEIRHCWSVVRPARPDDPDRKPVVRGTTQDITDRVRAEMEVKRSEAKLDQERALLALVLDNIRSGVAATDREGRLAVLNRSLLKMFGHVRVGETPEQMAARTDLYLADGKTEVRPEDRPLARALRGEACRDVELVAVPKDGPPRTIIVNAQPLLDSAGNKLGALASVEDVTEARAIQSQLQQAQKMEAVGQLTGGIAHDFNNLLGIIIGNLDSLIVRLHAPVERELANEALNGALRGAELTKQMLIFARRQQLDPTPVDVGGFLQASSGMLKRVLGEMVVIHTSVTDGLWPCLVDRSQLETALLNLAINARDAMPNGGTLTIAAANAHLDAHHATLNPEATPGDYVRISISDTGGGMSPDLLTRVLEPFFTTKDPGKGTGLGLSMVHGFVKQSGGHLGIHSEPGHGTSVNLYLRRASGGEDSARQTDHGAPGVVKGHETILVVDDNAGVRKTASMQLTELGYGVIEATDAKSALHILGSGAKVDLVFSDLIMPGGMTGFDLARDVRRLYPEVKIILVTGFAEAALRRRGDADDVPLLSKPYRRQELAARIRQVLDDHGIGENDRRRSS